MTQATLINPPSSQISASHSALSPPVGFRVALGVIGAVREMMSSSQAKENFDNMVGTALTGSSEEREKLVGFLAWRLALSQSPSSRQFPSNVRQALKSYLSAAFRLTNESPSKEELALAQESVAVALAQGEQGSVETIAQWLGKNSKAS